MLQGAKLKIKINFNKNLNLKSSVLNINNVKAFYHLWQIENWIWWQLKVIEKMSVVFLTSLKILYFTSI